MSEKRADTDMEPGRLFGIRSDLVMIAGYVISTCLAAIAGLILSGYVGLVDNWVG